MNDNQKQRSASKLSYVIFTFFTVILIAVLVWFVVDVVKLYQTGSIRPHIRHRPLMQPIYQPAQIQDWMTFRYVNYVFNLPSDYLKIKLNIVNSGYPNITLNKYAGSQKLNLAIFTESVRQAVGEYISGGGK